jgi:hypothetical protein
MYVVLPLGLPALRTDLTLSPSPVGVLSCLSTCPGGPFADLTLFPPTECMYSYLLTYPGGPFAPI